jgi:YHS domain-containing protein
LVVMVRALLLFLLVLLVVRAAWRLLEGVVRGAAGQPGSRSRPNRTPAAVKLVQDPVCGTFVVPGRARSLVRAGETVYFCSDKCRDAYAK